MQLSELRQRERSIHGRATFRGDEGLVPDSRGGLRPVECIERKLGTLLPDGSPPSPSERLHGTASGGKRGGAEQGE